MIKKKVFNSVYEKKTKTALLQEPRIKIQESRTRNQDSKIKNQESRTKNQEPGRKLKHWKCAL